MLKLLAGCGVLAGGAAVGIRGGMRLTGRRQALQDALLLLRLLHTKVQSRGGCWLTELYETVGQAPFQVLQRPERPAISQQGPAAAINRLVAAMDPGRLLSGQASQMLCEALQCALTREETAARLEYFMQLLENELERASAGEQRDKRLYCRLGWIGGALLAVLLW